MSLGYQVCGLENQEAKHSMVDIKIGLFIVGLSHMPCERQGEARREREVERGRER